MLKAIVKILTLAMFAQICYTMSMKQIKQTGKTLRKTCLSKVSVEEELAIIRQVVFFCGLEDECAYLCPAKVDVIKDGTFIEDKDVMCYIACIMKMINTIKNGKLNYEAAMKQADIMLPDEIREPAKVALTKCKKVPEEYKDVCESAFYTAKCIYTADPSIFFFP